MKINFNDLRSQWECIKSQCVNKIDKLFNDSDFILGSAVSEFENEFAKYLNVKYCVGTSNGTDALKLAAQSLSLSGTTLVLVPANTFIATIFGVEQGIEKPTFKLIDCDSFYQMDVSLLEECLEKHRSFYDNCVVVPVHLYGYTCEMDSILLLSKKYDFKIIEDASQAHGAEYNSTKAGSLGDVAAFSMYPGKNLGAAGDAGVVVSNNKQISKNLKLLRNLGSQKKYHHEIKAYNHRLDTIQAIILNEKLKHLNDWNSKRREIANIYDDQINNKKITLPQTPPSCLPVHHVYPVLVSKREDFQAYLTLNKIPNMIHYPIGISSTKMYKHLNIKKSKSNSFNKKLVSLPIHPFLTEKQVEFIVKKINNY